MLFDGREKEIDHVYDVYLSDNGTMLGYKQFDVDTNDFVIVNRVKVHMFVRININFQKNCR